MWRGSYSDTFRGTDVFSPCNTGCAATRRPPGTKPPLMMEMEERSSSRDKKEQGGALWCDGDVEQNLESVTDDELTPCSFEVSSDRMESVF